jgi:predicted membrane protein
VRKGRPGGGMSAGILLWGLLFSSIGLGFFLYGKKQRAAVPLVCGIVLMVYPYFIPNVIALVAIGVVLTAVPYFIRL